MYKLDFLPTALNDMVEIIGYISGELKNTTAASHLSNDFVEAAEGLAEFPYVGAGYIPQKPLKHEYRKVIVKNYIMFYWVDEAEKTVTVARVIYGKRDYGKALK